MLDGAWGDSRDVPGDRDSLGTLLPSLRAGDQPLERT